MATARSFADMLAQFLTIYLPVTRACSSNTVSAYRDAFTLFLRFMDQRQATPPDKVSFTDFTAPNMSAYLNWLRTDRHCCDATANQRLAAVKSFLRYVQAQAPEQIAQARQVLNIKAAQTSQPAISYLPVEAVGLLLKCATRRGLRDLALLTTLYDTAARIQEVCDLSIEDLHLGKPASATLTGKGRKTRIVPLTPAAAQILTRHVRTLPDDSSGPVFTKTKSSGSSPTPPATSCNAATPQRPRPREGLARLGQGMEQDPKSFIWAKTAHEIPRLTRTTSPTNYRRGTLARTMARLVDELGSRVRAADDDVWVVDSTPIECGRSKETAHRSDLAGWAEYGYCASHSRSFWGCAYT